jgi:membrane-bound lytic murein transglycosylase D
MIQAIFPQIRHLLRCIHQMNKNTHEYNKNLKMRLISSLCLSVLCLTNINTQAENRISNVNDDEITLADEINPNIGVTYPNLYLPANPNVDDTITNAPGPTDSALDASTENNADIWQRIKEGYAMPDATSSLVKKHEKAFSAKPQFINNVVDRSQKYLFHIVEEVQNRGMPTEIALLPMIESAYNPKAYSGSKASGIWQFIPSTGKNFGLKQNWWVDNRRSVTFATDAALSYLQKLHVMFGAWDLALAAYNAGEGTVRRAIEKNQKLGKPTDYAHLDLPAETRNYVPKLQAIKNIMTNPANYGVKLKSIENKAYFTTVSAPAQIDAKLAAELAGVSDEEFIALNPSYNRPVITATGDTHELLLPISAAQTFQENLAVYNKPLVSWKPYTIKPGEKLASIASKFDIPVDKLRKVNQLPTQKQFTRATTILVPTGNREESLSTDSASDSQLIDSNVDISLAQNSENIDATHLEKLQENHQLQDEEKKAKNNQANHEPTITHTVKNGDTLDKIAKKYKVSSKSIVSLNHLKKNQVKVGQKLTIQAANKQAKNKKNMEKSKSSKDKSTSNKSTAKNKTTIKDKKSAANKQTKSKQNGKIDQTKATNKQTKDK